MILFKNLPDFICASRAKHSAAADFASSICDVRSISISIPHPIAILTDCLCSGIKSDSTTS